MGPLFLFVHRLPLLCGELAVMLAWLFLPLLLPFLFLFFERKASGLFLVFQSTADELRMTITFALALTQF